MVVGLSKKSHGQAPSTPTAFPSASPMWKFPIRTDSLPFIKSSPSHHIVHSDGMEESIERLKGYLRMESELSSGISNAQPSPAASIRKKASTLSLNIVENRSTHIQRVSQQPGSNISGYALYCSSLARISGVNGQRRHGMPAFVESENTPGEKTYSANLMASPPLSRQASGEHSHSGSLGSETSIEGAKSPESLAHTQLDRKSSSSDTNAIIALYSSSSHSSSSSNNSSRTTSPVLAAGSKCRNGKAEEKCLYESRYSSPEKLGLVAIQMLSDEHLFDAASVPFPETPKTINSVNSSVVLPVPQGEMRDQSVVSASHIQRERTTSAPAASPPCTNDDPNTLRRLSQGANIGLPATLPRDDGRLHQKNCQLDYADMLHKLHEEYEAREMAREQQVKEMLHDAEARHKREIEETKKEFEQLLSRQTQKLQEQKIKYQKEANEATAEREELQYMLEEYIATSGKLIQQKEIEVDGFTRELRKVTLERQKLQQSVSECEAHANVLTGERNEAQERAKLLMTENARLEELNKNLHNDILVAEERSKLIKSHAQETLSKANTEISRLQKFLTQAKQDIAALRSQTAKVDARAKSLQIQLNSTKQQNKDLLVLCERFDGSLV